MATTSRPEPFSVNFQREVQAFLFLVHWKALTMEELRLNLKKMGVELIDNPRPIPHVPNFEHQLPLEDEYPEPEEIDPVVQYILTNNIGPQMYAGFPEEAFQSVEAFEAALEERGDE